MEAEVGLGEGVISISPFRLVQATTLPHAHGVHLERRFVIGVTRRLRELTPDVLDLL
jgi:hypothetical protein